MIIYDVVEKKAYPVSDFRFEKMTCDCLIAGELNISEWFATECGKERFAMLGDDGKALGDAWNCDREGTARAAEFLYKQPPEIVEAMHRIDMLEQAIAIHREKTKRPVQADRDLWELIDSAAVVG